MPSFQKITETTAEPLITQTLLWWIIGAGIALYGLYLCVIVIKKIHRSRNDKNPLANQALSIEAMYARGLITEEEYQKIRNVMARRAAEKIDKAKEIPLPLEMEASRLIHQNLANEDSDTALKSAKNPKPTQPSPIQLSEQTVSFEFLADPLNNAKTSSNQAPLSQDQETHPPPSS